jgi:chromosome segregation ATPase
MLHAAPERCARNATMSTSPVSGPIQPPLVPLTPLEQQTPTQETQQTSTQQATATTSLPPIAQYQALAFARASIETLGLDLPRTPEDTMAILSAVQQALDKTIDETRNNKAQALAASLRSAITGAFGGVGVMEAERAQFVAKEALRDEKKAERDQKIAERNDKINLSASLQTQIDAKNTQINNLNGQINTLNGQINTLNGQINTLNNEINSLNALIAITPPGAARDALIAIRIGKENERNGKQTEVNNKTTERNNAQATLNTVTNERNALVTQKAGVDAAIVQLAADIDRLAGEIATLETEMEGHLEQYFFASLGILTFFAPLATSVSALNRAEVSGNASSDAVFERLFENLADSIEEYSSMNRLREASQELLKQLESADAQTNVLRAVAGLLAGVVDVLSTLANLEDIPSQLTGVGERNGRLQFAVG